MKKIITIPLFAFLFVSCKSQQFFFHLIKNGVTSNVPSNIKNIQSIDDSSYEAFGFAVQNKVNQATYYYSHAITHTTGGKLAYRTYNIIAHIWSNYTIFQSDSIHIAGCSGGKMDNDSTVLFSVRTHPNVIHAPRDIYIQKVDSNNNFSPPVAFDWTGITKLQGGFFFGPLIHGDTTAHSGMILYQTSGDTSSTRYRISLIWTTDRWAHYYEKGVVHDGTLDYTETSCVNLGGGKYLALARKNNAGSLTPFESSDYGATWTRRPSSNLYWNAGGLPEIPDTWDNTANDSFNVFYECRDASMMQISKGNTVANFGTATFSLPEIYSFNLGTGGNPSLGYGSQLKLANGYFLMIYSKQFNNNRANIQWTIDNLVTDPGGIPVAPTIPTSSITTTSFRIDVTGYTNHQWENVRYMSMDLSTHADFSDFVTCKYRAVSAFPAVEIHDIRVTGPFVIFNVLTTGTTYYLRLKACNNAGCSAYTTINVTTL